jgi:hypothetical protein
MRARNILFRKLISLEDKYRYSIIKSSLFFFLQGNAQGIVEINLSKYPDFSIETHPPIGKFKFYIIEILSIILIYR